MTSVSPPAAIDIPALLHDLRNLVGPGASPRCAADAADLIERLTKETPSLRSGPCTCVDEFNRKLAEHNTRIIETIGLPRDGSPAFTRPTIQTEKIETRKRGGAAIALPSYCPFCGTAYSGYGAPITNPAPSSRGEARP